MATRKTTSIRLGDEQSRIDAHLRSGRYQSASDVMRAALRALDREEAALDEIMRGRIRAALDDPRPSIPADEVFSRLRAHHADQVKAAKREA